MARRGDGDDARPAPRAPPVLDLEAAEAGPRRHARGHARAPALERDVNDGHREDDEEEHDAEGEQRMVRHGDLQCGTGMDSGERPDYDSMEAGALAALARPRAARAVTGATFVPQNFGTLTPQKPATCSASSRLGSRFSRKHSRTWLQVTPNPRQIAVFDVRFISAALENSARRSSGL